VINKLCRLCQASLPLRPSLELIGMPNSAQFLPAQDELHNDKGVDLDIFECAQCSLVQTFQEPVPYYKEVIRASAFSSEMATFRQQQLKAWVDSHHLEGKSILEIGAGRGEYLQLLTEAGMSAYGTEYGKASVESCTQQGFRVWQAFPEGDGLQLPEGPFDAFASFNFMEHWPHPKNTLRDVAKLLKPNAFGLVEVPNFDLILKNNLFTEFISDHIFYFTAKTLRLMLETSGFEVIDIQSIWYDYILSATVRKRAPSQINAIQEMRLSIQQALHQFADQYQDGGIAVWGAGHQSLATLALLNLGGKIKYVVDSATFKQGKFTPATHLPIVPPSELSGNPVSAVIVIAAGYSHEVVKIIQGGEHSNLKIAVLNASQFEIL
jgi:2-polyprenyl-3-methyl-5-hydroxy-6-metoxy-1,4-benzoquinol methylase